MSLNSDSVVAMDGPVEAATLDDFLASVERRALRMAQVAAGDADAALDIVQDAMMKLVQRYADKPASEWRPLFFRILGNRITDWHRQQSSRWKVFDRWFSGEAESAGDPFDEIPHAPAQEPDQQLLAQLTLQQVEEAVRQLSPRQQQTFMLRCWEGLNTADTAAVMMCSEGTVKTLYSRAIASLRDSLGAEYAGQ